MKTLVWVEHEGGAVKDATLSTVTAASKLGEVHLLVAGAGVGGVAEAAAKIAGVGKVHVADDAAYEHALPEAIAPLVVELMGHHDAFVAPATANGKNIAPRVAALLDVGGMLVVDDFVPCASWPPLRSGRVDDLRMAWLADDRFTSVDVMVAEDTSVLIAVKQ